MKILQSTPDFLTSYVERVNIATKAALSQTGLLCPSITYYKNDRDFAFPFSYDAMVALGNDIISGPERGQRVLAAIGSRITGLALNYAERSGNKVWATEDSSTCLRHLVHMLEYISPDIFVVSSMAMTIEPKSLMGVCEVMIFGPRKEDPKRGVLVEGFSRIRSFSILSSFKEVDGNIKFTDENVMNIFDGGISNPMFGSVFTPRGN